MEISLLELYNRIKNSSPAALVRHYKIIKRNDFDSSVTADGKFNGVLSQLYKNEEENTNVNVNDNICIIDNINLDNIYKNESLINLCDEHNKNILYNDSTLENSNEEKIHFDSIDELKNFIHNKNVKAEQLYIDDIINIDFSYRDLKNLKNCLYKYITGEKSNFYIRMAPEDEIFVKEILLEKIYSLQNIEPLLDSNGNKLYVKDGIPVYNEDIIYPNKKYKKLTENTVKELLNSDNDNLNIKIEEL